MQTCDIHQWLYSPGLFFSFIIFFTQTIGLLGRAISPSQGHYIHTGQHKHRINAHADIHALSGIRTHDPSVRVSEDSSCLRPRSPCGRQAYGILTYKIAESGFIKYSNIRYLRCWFQLSTQMCVCVKCICF
jgi:hypothetical protein